MQTLSDKHDTYTITQNTSAAERLHQNCGTAKLALILDKVGQAKVGHAGTLVRLRGRGLPCVEALIFADPPLLPRAAVLGWPLTLLLFTTATNRLFSSSWCLHPVAIDFNVK